MQDLCAGQVDLKEFRGIAFVGGFSYADVCGSAKGKSLRSPQLLWSPEIVLVQLYNGV